MTKDKGTTEYNKERKKNNCTLLVEDGSIIIVTKMSAGDEFLLG
jgi:hypothetical protein